jgi:hypothetical protein
VASRKIDEEDSNCFKIRIVVDTKQDEKPNKKRKKHRGYAFVVYEREKDMRGNLTTSLPSFAATLTRFEQSYCTDMALMLPIFSLFSLFPCPAQGITSRGK